MRVSAVVASLCLGGMLISVPATAVTVTQQNSDNIFEDSAGNNNWSGAGSVSFEGGDFSNVNGGLFRLVREDPPGTFADFVAFCIEFEQFFSNGASYNERRIRNDTLYSRVDALFTNAYALVTDAVSAAAFQFALWEISTDAQLNFDTGDFRLQSTSNPQVRTTAAGYLQNIVSETWTGSGGQYTLLANRNTQDLVTLSSQSSDAPLPPSILLLMCGMAGIALLRRRREDA